MKHSGDADVSAAETITEVELNAEELQSLPSTRDAVVAQVSEPSCAARAPAAPSQPTQIRQTWLSSIRELSTAQVLGSVAVVIIASIALNASYNDLAQQSVAASPAPAWSPIPPRPTTIETDEPAIPPTLFKNPFDETEVFTFPPGTSREEARAMVADLLMKRARERLASGALTRS